VSPVDNENVGDGTSKEVKVTVKLVDATSNFPLYNSVVKIGDVVFTQSNENPELWSGSVSVPKEGVTVEIVATTVDRKEVRRSVKLLNKAGSLKPLVLGVNPGLYLLVYDPAAHRIAKITVGNSLWTEYVTDPRLTGTNILFDYNSCYEHAYTTLDTSNPDSKIVAAAGVGTTIPSIHYAGTVTRPVNLTYDGTAKRLLVVSKTAVNPDKYSALALPVPNLSTCTNANPPGFINLKDEKAQLEPVVATTAWDIPAEVVKGTFKSFAIYRKSNIFVIADERDVNGTKRTFISGYKEGANGYAEFKYSKEVGSDISNITINNNSTSGNAYFAENKSSLVAGKLKSMNLTTGEVSDLGESRNGITVANYSELRIDNTNQRLYIADAVSDSIFSVDLKTLIMTELPVAPGKKPETNNTID
jgi:hypothetical protein